MIIEEIKDVTPYGAFEALRRLNMPFFLERTEDGRRLTYVAADPFSVVRTKPALAVLVEDDWITAVPGAFEALTELLKKYASPEKGPFPFNSGAVGYFSYDLKDKIEPKLKSPYEKDSLRLPISVYGIYDPIFVYSHDEGKGYLVSLRGDKRKMDRFKGLFEKTSGPEGAVEPATGFTSSVTKEEYIEAIKKAKAYISEGDIYQINLSHRLTIGWAGDPFALFKSLIIKHPAPFASFLDMGAFQIISNSPERLLKVKDGCVETSPIKGTRPRGMDEAADKAFIEELKDSKKEKSEHVMIVDLERSDLGKISEPGTVEVTGFETVETYPNLHHMVSTVKGRLKPDIDAPGALKAVFPGGSITGAPKIRAMEIIDELETVKREIYTGGIGWFDLGGGADIAMAIRTAVYKSGELYLNVGGGIVADSDPEKEYTETILKARDFLDALGLKAQ